MISSDGLVDIVDEGAIRMILIPLDQEAILSAQHTPIKPIEDTYKGMACTADKGQCPYNLKYSLPISGNPKDWEKPVLDENCPVHCQYLVKILV